MDPFLNQQVDQKHKLLEIQTGFTAHPHLVIHLHRVLVDMAAAVFRRHRVRDQVHLVVKHSVIAVHSINHPMVGVAEHKQIHLVAQIMRDRMRAQMLRAIRTTTN